MEFEKEKQYMFVDFSPIDDCREPESYGEICIKCNKCGRFNINFEELYKRLRLELAERKERGKALVIAVSPDLLRYLDERCFAYSSPRAKDWRFIKGYFEGCPLIVENIATFKIFEEVK